MSPGMDVSMAEADLQKFGLIDVLRLTFLFNHKIKITKNKNQYIYNTLL